MAAPLTFQKYEGLGNDFLVVDAADEGAVSPERAVALCDRRFGVGADGVLLVLPPRHAGAVARMRVINSDGSTPEMCGNGVRCVAVHLGAGRPSEVCVDTDAGDRACVIDAAGDVTIDMGVVRVLGDRSIDLEGTSVVVTVADAGNPHAVLFGAATRNEAERIGPRIATHPSFPRGTNVEFAVTRPDGVDLVVWERGVGITMACGTGACATVAVAVERGLLPRGVAHSVRLPGGVLAIRIDDAGRAWMRGPARRVFSGTVG